MSMDTLDALLSGGKKTAKFETPGTTFTGTITDVQVRQATNFDTGKPEFWDDGTSPKQQIVVSIQTPEREDEDDDGVRAIYINAWGEKLKAFRAASAAVKSKPEPGDLFTATYTGNGPKPQKGYPPKLFKYTIVKGSPLDSVLGDQQAPSSEQFPAGLSDGNKAKAATLFGLGLDDAKVAQALTVEEAAVAIYREEYKLQKAADSSGGF